MFVKNSFLFEGKCGLEVGGPSQIFGQEGALPVYPIVAALDNVNYDSETFWSRRDQDGKFRVEGRELGRALVLDTSDLHLIGDESYDFILASHVVEHLSNPIKVLGEWRRIIRSGGAAIVIAPDRRRTYDRRREVTSLSHLLEDYRNGVEESDATHQKEVIALHDLSRDATVRSLEEHVARTMANAKNRIMHHHVFDESLLVAASRVAGFRVEASSVIWPYHIAVLLRKSALEGAS